MTSAFFHEDEYCQVEVLPAAATDYCRGEMGAIAEFAEAHRAGVGFTDMYVRQAPPAGLASLAIGLGELRDALDAHLTRFDHVLTGFSSHRTPCEGVVGWGDGDARALFASVDDSDTVNAIWLSLGAVAKERLENWRRALQALPRASELIIADWNTSEVVRLRDASQVETYLAGYHTGL